MGYNYSKSIDKNNLSFEEDLDISGELSESQKQNAKVNYKEDIDRANNTDYLMNNLDVIEKRLKILGLFKSDNAKIMLISVLFGFLMLGGAFASSVLLLIAICLLLMVFFNTDVYDSITDKNPGVIVVEALKKKVWAEHKDLLNKMTYMDADIWVNNKILKILTKNDYIDETDKSLEDYIVREVSSGARLMNVLEGLLTSYSNRFLSANRSKYKNIISVLDYYKIDIEKGKKNELT